MEIKPAIFFSTETTNGWWGNLGVFRAAERGKGIDCVVAGKKMCKPKGMLGEGFCLPVIDLRSYLKFTFR